MSLEKINCQLSLWWDETARSNMHSFNMLHNNLFPLLFQQVNGILKDDCLSKDILQDLFIKMWDRKEDIGPIQHVKAYFIKSARCMALNQIESARIKSISMEKFIAPDLEFSQEDVLVNHENDVELQLLLTKILNELPKRQREILFLKYHDGWTYEQISAITGIRYQSVVNHVHRAVVGMRGKISNRHFSPSTSKSG